MLKQVSDFFEKNMWSIIMVLIGLIIWGAKLQYQVNANEKDIIDYKYKVNDTWERVIRIEKDIEYIRMALDEAPIIYEVE